MACIVFMCFIWLIDLYFIVCTQETTIYTNLTPRYTYVTPRTTKDTRRCRVSSFIVDIVDFMCFGVWELTCSNKLEKSCHGIIAFSGDEVPCWSGVMNQWYFLERSILWDDQSKNTQGTFSDRISNFFWKLRKIRVVGFDQFSCSLYCASVLGHSCN